MKSLEFSKENVPQNPACKRKALVTGSGITGWTSVSTGFNAWVVAKAAMKNYFSGSSMKSCLNREET